MAPELPGDRRQRDPLGIGKSNPAVKLGLEDSVLSGQVLVTQQQLLIDSPVDVREHLTPWNSCTPAKTAQSLERRKISGCGRLPFGYFDRTTSLVILDTCMAPETMPHSVANWD